MDRPRDSRAGSSPALRALGARLRRWLRPPRTLRPTRAGWVFFALVFGVGFAALNTGNNLLYLVLSLMLAFLVLSGVLSESALRGIRVKRRLPGEFFAGTASAIALQISNTQRRVAAFAVVVEDVIRMGSGHERSAGRTFVLRVGAGERETRSYRLTPSRRGPLVFRGFRVSTRFPFGLFSKALTLDAAEEALVYPKVEPLRVPVSFGSPRDGGETVAGAGGRGHEVAGLREFAVGDTFRRIHWQTSLRRRQLVVREVESERHAEVEVRLRTAGQRPGEAFEKAVRWAASEAVALLAAGSLVALRTDDTLIAAGSGGRQRARLLSFLARIRADRAGAAA